MNNDIKLAKHYSSAKMHRALMFMEQFYMLSKSGEVSDKDKVCAQKLFEHYRRLAICILTKEMPEQFENELVVDPEFMKNMYRKYTA